MDAETLAEQAAPHLATLVHPGDGTPDNPPMPLMLGGLFGPYQLPDGMTDEDREEMGLPSPEFPKLFLEAVIHMLATKVGVTFVDTTELADLHAAAAANETKRNAQINLHCHCGVKLARLAVQDFDTDNPRVNGPALIQALGAMSGDCSTGHKR